MTQRIFSKLTTILFNNEQFVVDIIALSRKLPYFDEFKDEQEIDLNPINTIPKEIKDLSKVFEDMLNTVLFEETIECSPEIGWFILYFQNTNIKVNYTTPESVDLYNHLRLLDKTHITDILCNPNLIKLETLVTLPTSVLSLLLYQSNSNSLKLTYKILRMFYNKDSFNMIAESYFYWGEENKIVTEIKQQEGFVDDEIDKKIIEVLSKKYTERYYPSFTATCVFTTCVTGTSVFTTNITAGN